MPKKKRRKNDEPDTPEKPPELRGDEFEALQHMQMKTFRVRRGKNEVKSELRKRIEEVLNQLLDKKKEEEITPAFRLIDLLHDLWMAVTAEALTLTDEPEKCLRATHIALQLRTCIGLMCNPICMKETDDLVRANLDVLLDDFEDAPFLVIPITRKTLMELAKIDIPLALKDHRKELTGEEVEMKLAIVDLNTGELFWSDRYEVNGRKDMQGFVPVAPFYVGCTNYAEKVKLFGLHEGKDGIKTLPGVKEGDKEMMLKSLKHLILSFRLCSTFSPHIIHRDAEGRMIEEEE